MIAFLSREVKEGDVYQHMQIYPSYFADFVL